MRWILWSRCWQDGRKADPIEDVREFDCFRHLALYQWAWTKRGSEKKLRVSCIGRPLPEVEHA